MDAAKAAALQEYEDAMAEFLAHTRSGASVKPIRISTPSAI
jgi:hypothetical protein